MKIAVAGGTGFVGKALRENLVSRGHDVLILTRQTSFLQNKPTLRTRYVSWDPSSGSGLWKKELDGIEAVINLAGEPLVGKRWSPDQKEKLLQSRISSARAIVSAIQSARRKPLVLINASAIGFYGPHGDETLTEESPSGYDFLARTCKSWEAEAEKARSLGLRVVRMRFGIVLEKSGGALQKMLPPFRMGLGGPLGTGRQWMSWIHLKDLVELIHFSLERRELNGAVNATAPRPTPMEEFAATLGHVLGKPAFFKVPEFVLRALLGEMSDVLLKGQRVIPKKAEAAGFKFQFQQLEPALKNILR